MIVVTGAVSELGNSMIDRLNKDNFNHIVAVDESLSKDLLKEKTILHYVENNSLIDFLAENYLEVEYVFHLGTESSAIDFSQQIWQATIEHAIPLVYQSNNPAFDSWALAQERKPMFWVGLKSNTDSNEAVEVMMYFLHHRLAKDAGIYTISDALNKIK